MSTNVDVRLQRLDPVWPVQNTRAIHSQIVPCSASWDAWLGGKRGCESCVTVHKESEFPNLSIDIEYDILSVVHTGPTVACVIA